MTHPGPQSVGKTVQDVVCCWSPSEPSAFYTLFRPSTPLDKPEFATMFLVPLLLEIWGVFPQLGCELRHRELAEPTLESLQRRAKRGALLISLATQGTYEPSPYRIGRKGHSMRG
jgi:hypothetical protein